MRTIGFLALPFILVSLVGTTAHAANVKVGYVEMARAFAELEDSKTARTKLKKEFDKKQKQLDDRQKKLQTMKTDFDKRQAMMKDDVKRQKQAEMQKEFMELQQTYMQLQQELGKQEQELIQKISVKMKRVVERVGDREGFDMILDIGDTVLYYKKHQDITDLVIREYNREYGKK